MTEASAVLAEPSVLRLSGVTKRFGGTVALSSVDIEALPGEVHSLIGPNGAGKSTLVNVMAGAMNPDEGTIMLGDRRVDGLSPRGARRAGIARTFQRCRVFADMTCEENVRIGAYSAGGRRRQQAEKDEATPLRTTDELLVWARLDGRRHQLARSLALAEQRRLEIARALAAPARVLLLDEPTAGMGQNETAEVQHLVRQAADQFGMCVILVAHDMDLVMAVSDVVVVLDFGKVIAKGRPAQVRSDPRVIEAYLGPEDDE